MPFCASCGSPNPEGARFCAKCGQAMSGGAAAPAPQPTAPAPQPTAPAPQPTAPAPQPTAPAPQPTAPAPQPTAPAPRPKASFARGPDPNAPNQTQFFMAAAGVSTASKIKRVLIFVVVALVIGTGAVFLVRYALDKKEATPPAKTEVGQEQMLEPGEEAAASDGVDDKATVDEAAGQEEAKPDDSKVDDKKPT